MNSYNSINISMKVGYFIKMSESSNYNKADFKSYQQVIRKLIYLLYRTRYNITFAIGQLSKYNVDQKIGYIKAAKKIVWYLKSIIHLGLVYRS